MKVHLVPNQSENENIFRFQFFQLNNSTAGFYRICTEYDRAESFPVDNEPNKIPSGK